MVRVRYSLDQTGEEVVVKINHSLIQDLQEGVIQNDNGSLIWGDGNFNERALFCNASIGDYSIKKIHHVYGGEQEFHLSCFEPGCGPINSGPVWYIDASGNDDNDGSFEAPFATIQRAVNISVDGDTIRLNEGVYTESVDFEYKNLVLESMAFFSSRFNLHQESKFWAWNCGWKLFDFKWSFK